MRLHYYKDPHGNLGDDLNRWLWPRLIPDLLDDDGRTLFLGIGTILRDDVPRRPGKVVFGSGVGYGALPALDDRWQFYGVRGPRTASALGLDPSLAVTDPAVLVRVLIDPLHPSARSGVALVPHHESVLRAAAQKIDLESLARRNGLVFIDPRRPVDESLDAIRNARYVFAEAMHGAILADAFRVPWRPVQLYSHVLASKWHDWTSSLRLAYEPIAIAEDCPTASDFGRFMCALHWASAVGWALSDSLVLENAIGRLTSSLARLRADNAAGRLVVGENEDPPARSNPALPIAAHSWWHAIASTLEEIAVVVPANSTFALADDGQWAIDDAVLAKRAVRLPSLTPTYAGPPDHHTASEMLDVARSRGIRHVAIGWPSFWWLDVYDQLADGLEKDWECIYTSASCRVFEAVD
jgi:Polysaccharide pyruvyl transferase